MYYYLLRALSNKNFQVNNNFLKNKGSQIETVSDIVHTPIASLFKGAQLMISRFQC